MVDYYKARKCNKCNRPHNSFFYRNNNKQNDNAQTTNWDNKTTTIGFGIVKHTEHMLLYPMSSTSEHLERLNINGQVLLTTAVIKVMRNDNTWYTCRTLLNKSCFRKQFHYRENYEKIIFTGKKTQLPYNRCGRKPAQRVILINCSRVYIYFR